MNDKWQAIMADLARLSLAIAIIGFNAMVTWWVISRADVPKDLLLMLVNGSGLLAGMVVSYYFGSSAGSAAKDRINAQVKQ